MGKNDKTQRDGGQQKRSPAGRPRLSEAAAAIEIELDRFDELVGSAQKIPLNSQKNIERAAQATREAAASQEQFGKLLGTLIDAIHAARDRQLASAEAIQSRSADIQERAKLFEALLQRFGALGEEAKAINVRVQQIVAARQGAAVAENASVFVGSLNEVEERMAKVVEDATDLAKTAESGELHDLARQAEALKQQVHATRNKLGLLKRNLVGAARLS